MAKKKSSMFSGRTARSMEKSRSNYGYLKLPSNINVFKPEGSTEIVFDIVPYKVTDPEHLDNKKHEEDAIEGNYWWKRPIKVHRGVGMESLSLICPTTVGKPCPICQYGAKRRKAGAEWDELKDIFPKERTVFFIVPIDVQDCEVDYTEGEIHILDQSDHTFTEFLLEEVNRDISNDNFPDPYDGLSLRVYWRGKRLGKQKFAEASKIDFEERELQYDDDFLVDVPSLDDVMIIKDYKELEALYFGGGELDEDEIDEQEFEEEPPRRKARKTTSRKPHRQPKDEPEEAPEEAPEEEPEEEEKEPPKRRNRKTTRQAPEKEEPEDEEPPKRRRRTRKPKEEDEDVMECPYGHVFGEDNNQFDDCDECKIWDECKDANEQL